MGKFLKKDKQQKKQIKKYILWGVGAIMVFVLAVMPMIASKKQATDGSTASILTATAEIMDIDTQIIGGGQLSSEASLNVRIPENVKLTQYLVGNGDVVSEGEGIAKVDKISVMTAITEVQDTLDYLSDEIAAASSDTASDTVKALAGGTVKVIYANEGEAVQDVMLDHGALAVLSLDGLMAVKIERQSSLDVGDTVCVTLPDGTEADGRVQNNLEGVLTITMEDDDYTVGAKVTVTTEDGDRLGTGELYIYSQWNATAYSGTVADILVEENDTVYVGQTLVSLEDPGNTAQFQRLIDQRQEYEELMQELFTMYRTETITAPCDGIVTGVDEDGAYLLADDGEGWFASLLSFFGKEENAGFIAYAAKVAETTDSGMTLLMNPNVFNISEFAELSALPADISAMTQVWNYSGNATIYTQSSDGLLYNAGTAKAGDVLLAVGDEENVHWFVVLNGGSESAQVAQTESGRSGIMAYLLSDSDTPTDICTGDDNCVASSHNDGCPKNSVQLTVCTGTEGCEASEHGDKCPMNLINQSPSFFSVEDGNDEDNEDDKDDTQNGDETTVNIITTALSEGTVGVSYSSSLQASDGNNVLSGTWSASGMPSGLSIDSTTGTISGTPEVAGSCTVSVTFSSSANVTATKDFTLTIIENTPALQITTTTLGTGVVGQAYTFPMQVSGSNGGIWVGENLPAGLALHEQTGVISGTPTVEGTYTVKVTYTDTDSGKSVSQEYSLKIVTAETTVYTGYVAQIVEVKDGWAKVKQTLYSYTITDLTDLPKVSASTTDLTVEKEYTSDLIKSSELAEGDTFLLVVNSKGTVKLISKEAIQESTEMPGQGNSGQAGAAGGSASGGGGTSAGGGMSQTQTYEVYSLGKLTVASVTSQEHMTVSITIDELDITKIYVGQAAIVSVDALGGEQFDAAITSIAASGENDGGNSKFAVELTLEKSGEMLPGMYSSAFITLETAKDALCIPVAALDKVGTESIVYTSYNKEEGTLGDPVVVTIGSSDGENVEILGGFTAGQTCYYEYYDTYVGSDTPQQQGGSFDLGRMLGGR